jgi:DNA-binding transcriptional ArsR family regulator
MPAPDAPLDQPAPGSRLRFDDPRSIRALAHPARLAIIDALGTGDELTATQCAKLTGLSPSATAYHLKALEQYGYAEPAAARPDRRERPWRATRRPVEAYLDNATPANAAATAAFVAAYIDETRGVVLDFIEAGPQEAEQWRDASMLTTSDLWLTPEESREVAQQLTAVLEPFRDRAQQTQQPPGTRRVRIMNILSPRRDATRGSPAGAETRRR